MPALPALAMAADLLDYGYPDAAEAYIGRASVRVRRYTRQQITPGTSTVTLHARPYRLPQRPVTDVVSVATVDGDPLEFDLKSAGILDVDSGHDGPVVVEYDHGYAVLPDDLIELVCSIAARMATTPEAVGSGVTAEQAGPFSVSLGSDAWRGTTGLTTEEKATLNRLFPRLPSTTVLRP